MPYGELKEAATAASLACPAWQQLLREQSAQAYFAQLDERVSAARQTQTVYPSQAQVFAAFEHTPLAHTKVVILGQDPYHQPGQAHGLAFSVPEGVKVPPSLRNIYKAIAHDDPEFVAPEHGDLQAWAAQGVLLLNTVLTVEHGKAHAHARWGWETFTDAVMARLNAHPEPIVFLLWGKHAQQKGQQITNQQHTVLESVHPSPLSAHRGFITCGHFAEANRVLSAKGRQTIDWQAVHRATTAQKQQRQQKLAL
ncbi:uracil-DNA glycosylase [Aliidiomarina maris]|uniref:Uracil-DNA glycosylase n=1 Tax=Aliidiomarina maris TaxID=531312 RepID=A0A327X4M6_9GAMM|nr:uracil-DNA glycosylase [Aliidiomarina maris]RAK00659.1 uracil-DNA glycosylase [Aliidiomarina maris]RUO27333.1 uracil-DNA glycosylase [Aliidiomarina maris]